MDTTPKDPLKNNNADRSAGNRNNKIYMSIDHLKRGSYSLNILEKEKVIKSIKIKKQ